MKNKFLLVGNGPYLNCGCEAIVRGTVNILEEHFSNTEFINATIFSKEKDFEEQKTHENDSNIITESILGYKYKLKLIDKIKRKINKYHNIYDHSDLEILKKYIDSDVKAILSVGGDNYSLDYERPDRFIAIDNFAIKNNIPLVIWGASVGPFSKDKKYEQLMKEHLKLVTAIFARENETVKYLNSIGIKDNVYKICDPAFCLEVVKPKMLKENSIRENSIGFNISPLMLKHCNMSEEEFINHSVEVINRLIENTMYNIYLIPHVTISTGSDYDLMKKVYEKVSNKDKVVLIENKYNASELKWIISKMNIFFGARTHATIAALSTVVPTLSFVYSMKSIGINKDFFNNERYCIYPKEYNNLDVVNKIIQMLENQREVKKEIQEILPQIKELSMMSGKVLKELLNK